MPAPRQSVFYGPDALPDAQQTFKALKAVLWHETYAVHTHSMLCAVSWGCMHDTVVS